MLQSFALGTYIPSIAMMGSDLSWFSVFKFSVIFLTDVCIFLISASWIKDPWLQLTLTGTIHMSIPLVWWFLYNWEGAQFSKVIGNRLVIFTAALTLLSNIFTFWHITMYTCWTTTTIGSTVQPFITFLFIRLLIHWLQILKKVTFVW